MAEMTIGIAFAVVVIAAIFWRERFVSFDITVRCPEARGAFVDIRGGVCRRRDTGRLVGVASGCHRACLRSAGPVERNA